MKRLQSIFMMALTIFLIQVVAPETSQANPLTVGADSSLEIAFKELIPLFEHEYGKSVRVLFGPSKILRSAIEKGKTIDVLITSTKEFVPLQKANLLLKHQPQLIAQTSFVLVSSEGSPILYSSFRELLANHNIKIAVADSQFSSLGELTAQFLFTPKIAKRAGIVYTRDGKDISKFLHLGKADVGIMYRAEAINRGAHIIEEFPNGMDLKDQIGAGIIANIKKSLLPTAQDFVNFMSSPRVQMILSKYGYEPFSPIKRAAHLQSNSPQLQSTGF